MHLKLIKAIGFKSFADLTKIKFNKGVTGVVGPNGSGKSNINDSIRWVLGEQSAKSLRGDNMDDVIFKGSDDKPPVNMAEVSLVFDNGDGRINLDFKEVEITRRLYKGSGENEYYINKERVRLKDVTSAIAGTGLSKGSLNIISQGTVAEFVSAKPEQRRVFFEEAAGVSKYKRHKMDSSSKLEKTLTNLDRIKDALHEINKEVNRLEKQSTKAKQLKALTTQLKQIEIGVILQDVNFQMEFRSKTKKELEAIDRDHLIASSQLHRKKTDQQMLTTTTQQIVDKVDTHYDALQKCTDAISKLNAKKAIIENKIDVSSLTSKEAGDKAKGIKQQFLNLSSAIRTQIKTIEQDGNELTKLEQKSIEIERDRRQNAEHLKAAEETKSSLQARIDVSKDVNARNSSLNIGPRTIMEQKNVLSGIVGTVSSLITVEPEYQLAIDNVLGGARDNIITKTDEDAKYAVNFLKKNRRGRATFLPLNNLRVNYIDDRHIDAIAYLPGFVGIANELVNCKRDVQEAIDFLLARIIVVETLDNAVAVSKSVGKRFRVVSLDGQTVNVGGSVTGGDVRARKNNIILSADSIQAQRSKVEQQQQIINQLYTVDQTYAGRLTTTNNSINSLRTRIAIEKGKLTDNENKANSLNSTYEELMGEKITLGKVEEQDTSDEKVYELLNIEISKRTQIEEEIKGLRLEQTKTNSQKEALEREMVTLRDRERTLSDEIKGKSADVEKSKFLMTNQLQRLAEEYQITYETAKEKFKPITEKIEEKRELVKQLRQQINEIGSADYDSIELYEEEKARRDLLDSEHAKLSEAHDGLVDVIATLDQMMITKFDSTIQQINAVLPELFKRLFGGGTSQLLYTNPDDILETGVEIQALPPGKRITNLKLLSGGEQALVALSVLFAILKVTKTPLSILDEAEAALDPTNADRFSKILNEFTGETQFIVITHRQETMRNCGFLYGVTMQIKGVTKILSVNFENAEKLIEH